MLYSFEWDPRKARQNVLKHKVSFQRAGTIFLDRLQISIFDEGHSQEEDRWVTIGKDSNDVVIVVAHTFSRVDEFSCRIRIISARKATRREKKQYDEGTR